MTITALYTSSCSLNVIAVRLHRHECSARLYSFYTTALVNLLHNKSLFAKFFNANNCKQSTLVRGSSFKQPGVKLSEHVKKL